MEWISVKDRLPGLDDRVLMAIEIRNFRPNGPRYQVESGYRRQGLQDDGGWVSRHTYLLNNPVIYWMPWPKPPTE
jgi:hypothetical protein